MKQTKKEENEMKLEQMEPELKENQINHPRIVSQAEWLVARKDLLSREKEFTRLRDKVSRHRRELPLQPHPHTSDEGRPIAAQEVLQSVQPNLVIQRCRHAYLGPNRPWKAKRVA